MYEERRLEASDVSQGHPARILSQFDGPTVLCEHGECFFHLGAGEGRTHAVVDSGAERRGSDVGTGHIEVVGRVVAPWVTRGSRQTHTHSLPCPNLMTREDQLETFLSAAAAAG